MPALAEFVQKTDCEAAPATSATTRGPQRSREKHHKASKRACPVASGRGRGRGRGRGSGSGRGGREESPRVAGRRPACDACVPMSYYVYAKCEDPWYSISVYSKEQV